jgi:hypothetical protein
MSQTDRPIASTTRDERLVELQSRVERIRFRMRSLNELADEIDGLQPRCQGYEPIWHRIAERIRLDAGSLEHDLARAQERLSTLSAAADAAVRHGSE